MKKIFPALVFLLAIRPLAAQDLLVTMAGDSLNCKITKVNKEYIYYTYKEGEEVRNALLPMEKVSFYRKNHYSVAEVPPGAAEKQQREYPRIRVGLFGGWSYLIAPANDNVPSYFNEYIQELRSGYHLGGDAGYFFHKNLGAGLRYSVFRTRNQIDNVLFYNQQNGQTFAGSLVDDIKVQYIGPWFCARIVPSNEILHLYALGSFGYMSYRNEGVAGIPVLLTSNTLGLAGDIGIDVLLSDYISLGVACGLTLGVLTKYQYDDGTYMQTVHLDEGSYDNISRLDLSAAIRFHY